MIFYSANEFYLGIKIIFDNEPCEIINNEFIKPGKGRSFNRVRLKKLISNKILDKIFKSSDLVEKANLIDVNLIYLYNDNRFWYFINNKNFEQISVNNEIIGSVSKWLTEQIECILTLWNNKPISVKPPNFVELKIIKTEPFIKGNTIGSCNKLAVLHTGAIVKVPLFIQVGQTIKVDTRSKNYISRVK